MTADPGLLIALGLCALALLVMVALFLVLALGYRRILKERERWKP